MKSFNFNNILSLIPANIVYEVLGDSESNIMILNAKPTLEAESDSLTFIDKTRSNSEKISWSNSTNSKLIITDLEIHIEDKIILKTEKPKILFSILVSKMFIVRKENFIHESAIIFKNSKIGLNCYIGAHVVIEKNVEIGDDVIINSNVTIKENSIIGNNVIIESGSVIGGEGFGFLRDKELGIFNFPHIGGVILEDAVEIGANNTIDRGALSNTILKSNVKTDSLVHIAHNVLVGERTLIMANAMISGSVIIGADSWIAPSSSIKDGLKIGANVTVGIGAVVTKNIPDNQVWTGNPAQELGEFARTQRDIRSINKKK